MYFAKASQLPNASGTPQRGKLLVKVCERALWSPESRPSMNGDEAEIAFDAVPGRVFKAKVRLVLDAIAAGQMQATGALVDFGARTEGGRALAIIDIEDDMSPYQIPLGAAAQVAIYTEHWHHVSLLRKILLRMRSWQNYIFLEGH